MKPQTFINMGFTRTVKAGCSYLKSTVSKKEETSLENFYINRFGKVLYSMFFEATPRSSGAGTRAKYPPIGRSEGQGALYPRRYQGYVLKARAE